MENWEQRLFRQHPVLAPIASAIIGMIVGLLLADYVIIPLFLHGT